MIDADPERPTDRDDDAAGRLAGRGRAAGALRLRLLRGALPAVAARRCSTREMRGARARGAERALRRHDARASGAWSSAPPSRYRRRPRPIWWSARRRGRAPATGALPRRGAPTACSSSRCRARSSRHRSTLAPSCRRCDRRRCRRGARPRPVAGARAHGGRDGAARPRGPSRARMGRGRRRRRSRSTSSRPPRRASSASPRRGRSGTSRRILDHPEGARFFARPADPLERQRGAGQRRERGAAHRPARAARREAASRSGGCSTTSCSHAPESSTPYRRSCCVTATRSRAAQPGEAVRCAFITGDGPGRRGGLAPVTRRQARTARDAHFRSADRPSRGLRLGSNRGNFVSRDAARCRLRSLRSLAPPRAFGRFALRRLLGKSEATMVWLAVDTRDRRRDDADRCRARAGGAAALGTWLLDGAARRAARPPEPRPGRRVRRARALALRRRRSPRRRHARRVAGRSIRTPTARRGGAAGSTSVLRGLAFAHDAGVAHLDLQLHSIARQRARPGERDGARGRRTSARRRRRRAPRSTTAAMPLDPRSLRAQRAAAERDVLACGLLLHRLLAGAPALGGSRHRRA